uniref:Uncharacterized protein n=1 Tax=Oryza glumipatula TaxID=40148 RepID=A0A0E0B0P4_9ORYZ
MGNSPVSLSPSHAEVELDKQPPYPTTPLTSPPPCPCRCRNQNLSPPPGRRSSLLPASPSAASQIPR